MARITVVCRVLWTCHSQSIPLHSNPRPRSHPWSLDRKMGWGYETPVPSISVACLRPNGEAMLLSLTIYVNWSRHNIQILCFHSSLVAGEPPVLAAHESQGCPSRGFSLGINVYLSIKQWLLSNTFKLILALLILYGYPTIWIQSSRVKMYSKQ